MKKIITFMCVAVMTCFAAFAEMEIAPGIRFSVLGVEPTVSLNIDDLEVEAGFAFARDASYYIDTSDDYRVMFTPNITFGWNYDAFDTGWHNLVGASYYLGMGFNSNETDVYHMIGMAYRGSVRFRSNLEICAQTCLPFLIVHQGADEPLPLTIADNGGIWECALLGLCMSSIGIRIGF